MSSTVTSTVPAFIVVCADAERKTEAHARPSAKMAQALKEAARGKNGARAAPLLHRGTSRLSRNIMRSPRRGALMICLEPELLEKAMPNLKDIPPKLTLIYFPSPRPAQRDARLA